MDKIKIEVKPDTRVYLVIDGTEFRIRPTGEKGVLSINKSDLEANSDKMKISPQMSNEIEIS